MAVSAFKHWTIGILLLSILSIDLLIGGTFGAESTKVKVTSSLQDKKAGGEKVKCKEHIEEALRKYWDHEKGVYVTEKIADQGFVSEEDESNAIVDEEEDDIKTTAKKSSIPVTTGKKVDVKGKDVKIPKAAAVTPSPAQVKKPAVTPAPATVEDEDDDDSDEDDDDENDTDVDGTDTEENETNEDIDEKVEADDDEDDDDEDDEDDDNTDEDDTEEDDESVEIELPKSKAEVKPAPANTPVKVQPVQPAVKPEPQPEKPRVGRLPVVPKPPEPVKAKFPEPKPVEVKKPEPPTEKPRIGRLPVTTTTPAPVKTAPAPPPPPPPPSPAAKPVEKPRIGRLPVVATTSAPPKEQPKQPITAKPAEATRVGRLPAKAEPKFVIEELEPDSSEEDESNEEFKSRSQVEDILKLHEIGTPDDVAHETIITSTFKELKKTYENAIKPLEATYKYKFISNRLITDAEIYSKPMVLFLGAKSSGKTSLVNYLLGLESTPWQLRTGVSNAPQHFTILEHGDTFSKLSPMEISADFAFSNLQQFGQHFVENHLEAYKMPLSILQRVTIVDSPGLVDGILNKAPEPGKAIDSEVYQWFVDRADIIFIAFESSQVHLTQAMKDLLEQLKGRDVRFIISKAESMSQTQCVMLIGQLLWSLSPVMPADKPPQVYALTTSPVEEYNPWLDMQEQEWLQDLAQLISGVSRVESRAAAIRRHAVRVRNHAKVVDCYLSAYYRRKPLFAFGQAAKKLATDITENPHNYNIFKGALAGITQNVSRYDLPDPDIYREFFRVNALLDFKQLSQTCSFFSGCAIDKLDAAIAYKIPGLVEKYKKQTDKTKGQKKPATKPAATTTTSAQSTKKKA